MKLHCVIHGVPTRSYTLKRGSQAGRQRAQCPLCNKEHLRAYRLKNPSAARRHNLKKYGITEADWTAMFISQRGLCAVCVAPLRERKNETNVDHCHDTGVVRGLLCQKCNAHTVMGIERAIKGGFLERAITYVVENAARETSGTDWK